MMTAHDLFTYAHQIARATRPAFNSYREALSYGLKKAHEYNKKLSVPSEDLFTGELVYPTYRPIVFKEDGEFAVVTWDDQPVAEGFKSSYAALLCMQAFNRDRVADCYKLANRA